MSWIYSKKKRRGKDRYADKELKMARQPEEEHRVYTPSWVRDLGGKRFSTEGGNPKNKEEGEKGAQGAGYQKDGA